MALKSLKNYRRITVKIGSALLVDRSTGLKREWLASLADDIAGLTTNGADVLVVSSGAIALGRTILDLGKRVLKLEESQAAAAVGQIALAGAWSEELARRGLKSGQILVTLGDTEERRRYLNARATISTLIKMKAVPVINENDTVATSEIRYGDNDRLAARVATMMGADLLVLLSDIDGLYTAPPTHRSRREVHPRCRAHHPGNRGHGRSRRLRTLAWRHAHQTRRRQDRHRCRCGDDHHRRHEVEPAFGHRAW